MKKPVKIIFSVVLSVAMVLSLALTAYGASSLTFDFTVTVKKGKVFDENGDLYTGWYIKNRHKYYAESGRRVRGWKKIGKQYYYFAADYAISTFRTGWSGSVRWRLPELILVPLRSPRVSGT